MDARILELDRDGGAPRTVIEGVPMANAFQIGPDGKLYVPVMAANEIWRVDVETGAHEVVAGNLGVPDSVKFDRQGRIVTTQVASGEVLRLDLRSGRRETLANLGPGLDNVTFVGDRIFVSSINGSVTEILEPGRTRSLIQRGLQWPLGIAAGADGGLFVCDGVYGYALRTDGEGSVEDLTLAGMLFWPGSPGYLRGVSAGGVAGEWLVTTGLGSVARYRPGAGESDVLGEGFDRLMGIAATARGAVVFAEFGTGRVHTIDGGETSVLARGLDAPMGVAVHDDTVYVSESGAGRVVRLSGGAKETVAEGLGRPQGLCAAGGRLFAVDVAGKRVLAIDAATGQVEVIATGLPVGAPPGIIPRPLRAIGMMAGPMINFADIAAGADGALFLAGDAEGSVLALRPPVAAH